MQRMLEQSVRSYRRRTAIVDGDTLLTYEDLGERVVRLANGLRALGLGAGDRVAILALNSHRFSEWYFACASAGLVGVPLNARFSPGDLAAYLTTPERVR